MSEGIITRRASDIRPLLLDRFRNAAAAYSLRPLTLSGQDNPVVKVRRNSDNAEQDFSPAEINDGSLLTFVGNTASDNGFVTTWYDQSGNGNHATQSTAASQPKIVSAGSLVVESGKAALDFDGSDDGLQSSFSALVQPTTFFAAATLDTPNSSNFHFIFDSENSIERNTVLHDNSNVWVFVSGSLVNSSTTPDSSAHLHSGVFDSASSVYYLDSNLIASGNTGSQDLGGITIGARYDVGDHFWNGTIQELLIYNSDQSLSRQQIESNINNHYGIY